MAGTADPTKDDRAVSAVDETTPLLNAGTTPVQHGVDTALAHADGTPPPKTSTQDNDPTAERHEEIEKPMPVLQVLLLCYASLAEPVAYFSIFPFVNEMIYRTGHGLVESDVGYWSGLIESLFSLVQMVLMIFYGRAADRMGRKPILIFSLGGMAVATALFGLSRSLTQMVLTRCFSGVFAGSAVTIRTMLSENCTKRNQARAFSWYMFCRNLGIFLGPLFGGALADPNFLYGWEVPFFSDYPYALATFGAGSFTLTMVIASLLFLRETLPAKADGNTEFAEPMSTWEVLKSPGVPIVLYIFGHTMLLALAYTAVSPVFLFTSIEKGGFGFSDASIAGFLCIAGGSQAAFMLLAFPPLQQRYGTGNVLRGCAIVWPVAMAAYPLFNELLRLKAYVLFWCFGPLCLVLGSGVSMAFACVQLFINDISPSSSVLATVNALSLTVNSGVRAFAPVAFTSLYAVGVKLQWADGHLIWLVLVAIALVLNVVVYFLPAKAEGRYGSDYDQQRHDSDGEAAR